MLTWAGLIYGVLFVIMCFALLLKYAWPRDKDGKMMDLDEVNEIMSKLPKEDHSYQNKMLLLFILLLIASIAYGLFSAMVII